MADKEPKIYCGSGKRKTFSWGSLVEETLDLDTLIEAFNNHGYVNKQGRRMVKTTISQRKEEGNYGETHYSTINTWHPDGFVKPTQIAISDGRAKATEPVEIKPTQGYNKEDDIPF